MSNNDVTCLICSEQFALGEFMRHLRLMHPDDYEPLECWPDGRPVIIDQTDYSADDIAGAS